MAFPLGPAVIICLPSIVNPDAVGGGGKGGGVGGVGVVGRHKNNAVVSLYLQGSNL